MALGGVYNFTGSLDDPVFLGPLGPLEQSLSVGPSVRVNENTNNTCIPTTVLYSTVQYCTVLLLVS